MIKSDEGFLSISQIHFEYEIDRWNLSGIKSLNQLFDDIILQAQIGVNVHEKFASFVQSMVNVKFCDND